MATKSTTPAVTEQTDPLGLKICSWYTQMDGEAGQWKSTWQDLGDYAVPRKDNINKQVGEGQLGDVENLYNTTAIESAQIHAGGEMDYLFSGNFAKWQPPRGRDDDEAKRWCAMASEVMMEEILKSNFLLEAHEFLGDRVGFGTGMVYAEWDNEEDRLNFCNDKVGTYFIGEGRNKIVNTVLRKVEMSVQKAVEEFGRDGVGRVIGEEYDSGDLVRMQKKHEFVHAIYPRLKKDRKANAVDGPNKPIASVHVSLKDKHVCRNSGYDEMPAAVSRYLKWRKDPYGYCPTMIALPTIKQVNFIERCMDALAETKAFPRVLIPDNLDGNDVDFRATGQTVFDANRPDALPREWLDKGEYQIGLERIQSKNELIKRLYLVDLWQMLAQIERDMTAYEVAQRLAEKLTGISPAFHRMQTEFFNPMFKRIFGLLYRAGKFVTPDFPAPPASMMKPDARDPANPAKAELVIPEVVLTGKLAMAIQAAASNGIMQWAQMMMPMAEVMGPEVLDPVDMPKASARLALNLGVPVDVMRSAADIKKLQQGRAQQAQQQAALQAAQVGAQAAANVSKASPEIQKAITGQARN